jgi:hypothetical protein
MQPPVTVKVDLEVYIHCEVEDSDPHTVLLVKPNLNRDFSAEFLDVLALVKLTGPEWHNTMLYDALRERGWVFSVVNPQFVVS